MSKNAVVIPRAAYVKDLKYMISNPKTISTFSAIMQLLVGYGCYPCCSYRGGGVYRVHINSAGNHWAEGKDLDAALREAVRAWLRCGCPMDGLAADSKCNR